VAVRRISLPGASAIGDLKLSIGAPDGLESSLERAAARLPVVRSMLLIAKCSPKAS